MTSDRLKNGPDEHTILREFVRKISTLAEASLRRYDPYRLDLLESDLSVVAFLVEGIVRERDFLRGLRRTYEGRPPEGCVLLWQFHAAPADLRHLSDNGGDEDWIAVVPAGFTGHLSFLDKGSFAANWFGCASIDAYDHPTIPGAKVYIGSHA